MIFITLGTQDKSFKRLLEQVDREIEKKTITEKVIVQAGYTKYDSENMEIFDFDSPEKIDRYIDKSRIVITHGGVGSILSSLKKGKVVIAASRLKKYKEHTNDHQKQIVKEFADRGYILELRDFGKLGKVLEKAEHFKPRKFVSNTDNFLKIIDNYIEEDNHISWYNKYKEVLWYAFFGGLTTLVNIVSFYLLDKLGINLYVSNLFAWILSVIFAFLTNKFFVFNSTDFKYCSVIKEMVSFFFFRLLSLGIDMFGMYLFINMFNINKIASKIFINIVVIVANYIFSKLFVFKK